MLAGVAPPDRRFAGRVALADAAGDDEHGGVAATVEVDRVVEAGAEHGRRAPDVLGGAEDDDRVGLAGFLARSPVEHHQRRQRPDSEREPDCPERGSAERRGFRRHARKLHGWAGAGNGVGAGVRGRRVQRPGFRGEERRTADRGSPRNGGRMAPRLRGRSMCRGWPDGSQLGTADTAGQRHGLGRRAPGVRSWWRSGLATAGGELEPDRANAANRSRRHSGLLAPGLNSEVIGNGSRNRPRDHGSARCACDRSRDPHQFFRAWRMEAGPPRGAIRSIRLVSRICSTLLLGVARSASGPRARG